MILSRRSNYDTQSWAHLTLRMRLLIVTSGFYTDRLVCGLSFIVSSLHFRRGNSLIRSCAVITRFSCGALGVLQSLLDSLARRASVTDNCPQALRLSRTDRIMYQIMHNASVFSVQCLYSSRCAVCRPVVRVRGSHTSLDLKECGIKACSS